MDSTVSNAQSQPLKNWIFQCRFQSQVKRTELQPGAVSNSSTAGWAAWWKEPAWQIWWGAAFEEGVSNDCLVTKVDLEHSILAMLRRWIATLEEQGENKSLKLFLVSNRRSKSWQKPSAAIFKSHSPYVDGDSAHNILILTSNFLSLLYVINKKWIKEMSKYMSLVSSSMKQTSDCCSNKWDNDTSFKVTYSQIPLKT